ncbi:hypothetical protein C0J50_16923 [Silurus asotus]|uniref:Uncharacterized protein n=1 Tax=Silurus asotus TaxID=30991 RepID=A0AAD5AVG2_SILAS|nr:hypothetical protein C0J50_16923 [Silurus asotus]
MEKAVFIEELPNIKTSKGMWKSRHFQYSSRYLLLTIVVLLGLLIGAIVGLFIVWTAQVPHQLNIIQRVNMTKIFSGEQKEHPIYTVPQNGTYFIYGTVQKNEGSPNCEDVVKLAWTGPRASGELNDASFLKNSIEYSAVFKLFDVQLDKNRKGLFTTSRPVNTSSTTKLQPLRSGTNYEYATLGLFTVKPLIIVDLSQKVFLFAQHRVQTSKFTSILVLLAGKDAIAALMHEGLGGKT